MNTENDHDYFRCELRLETDKSYCVNLERNGADFWIPKSLCELKNAADNGSMYNKLLEVESWFAKKEGMHDD